MLKFKYIFKKEMPVGIEVFKKHLREKRAIKLSLGSNIDANKTALIATCAQNAHASAIDIACDKKSFEIAKKHTKLPIFASSNHPFSLQEALKWGVDGIEIGSFNSLRKKGKMYSPHELYNIVLETCALANDYDTFISVCIPKEYNKEEKANLVKKLELLGIDLIRLETSNIIKDIQELSEIANASIIPFAFLLENANDIKTIFENGFCAVDVEYIAQKYESLAHISTTTMTLVGAISHRNSINKEILRTSREMFAY